MKGRNVMKRKFLEELGLENKELIDKILDENSADIGRAKGELESVQEQLKTVKAELDTAKGQITERDNQLTVLKESSGNVEQLKKQIEELQNANKDSDTKYAEQIKQMRIDSAVEQSILKAGGINGKAIKALLDSGKFTVGDDGVVGGIEEQIETLKKAEDSKMLFHDGKATFKGAKVHEGEKDGGSKGTDYSKMSYEELCEYLKDNPDAKLE